MCTMAETPSEGEIRKTQGRREVRSHLRDESASGKKGYRRILDDPRKHCNSTTTTYNAIISKLSKSIYDRIPLLLTHTWREKKLKDASQNVNSIFLLSGRIMSRFFFPCTFVYLPSWLQ